MKTYAAISPETVSSEHLARLMSVKGGIRTPFGVAPTILESISVPRQIASKPHVECSEKVLRTLDEVFECFSISDGQTLSFHHHYRNGDRLINEVLMTSQRLGICDLTIAPSSIFPVHADLVPLIQDGTITNIITDYMRGPVADSVVAGELKGSCLLQSHGGRARAIASGQLKIDVAFVAAPLASFSGDTTGRGGRMACGPLGYPAVDAAFASHTVVVTDELTTSPLSKLDIPGHYVDAILQMDKPGMTDGIQSGATVPSLTESARQIGAMVAACIEAAGLLRSGVSLQSGAGGYSLGAVASIGARMQELGVQGSFLSGGITASHVKMLETDLFAEIKDVQCFDLEAVRSSIANETHHMMTAAEYASPIQDGAVVDELDIMLLGAVEVDARFNVNVVLGGNGGVLGGPGGHPDTAAGAKLRIVTTELTGGGYAKLVPEVQSVSTPGWDIDLIVTDQGIAVNPIRADLQDRLVAAGLPVRPFAELCDMAAAQATKQPHRVGRAPTVWIEARDGRILDFI
jgi:citrate lyase subunit alpha / citrate CoA-transferase